MIRFREKVCRFLTKQTWLAFIALFFLLTLAFFVSPARTAPLERSKVLILHPFEPFLPYSITVNQAIRSAVFADTTKRVDFYSEYLDLARFPDKQYVRRLVELYRKKYSGNTPDVIIALLKPSLEFVLTYGQELFPGVPIVFCTVERYQIKDLTLGQNVTGVLMEVDPKSTLDIALKLHPETERIVVISGAHANDKGYEATVREAFRAYEERLDFLYLSAISMDEVLRRVTNLPRNTLVFYVTMFQDGTGKAFVPKEVARMIAATSNRPVYGLFDSYFGVGIVGGRLVSFESQGKKAAELSLRILKGEKPADIPVAGSPNVSMFDWRQLQHWRIKENRLPSDSMVYYRVATVWDTYKWHIIVIIVFLLSESILIIVLFLQRVKRRKAEKALLITQFSLDHASDGVIRIDPAGKILYGNEAFCRHLGCSRDELLTMTVPDVNPDFTDFVWPGFMRKMEEHRTITFETRHRVKGGRIVPVEVRTDLVEFEGQRYLLAFIRDVTERKKWEEALVSEKQRFLTLMDNAPFGMVLVDKNGYAFYINPKFREVFGYDLDDVRKGEEWFRMVFPDETYRRAVISVWRNDFTGREPGEREPRTSVVTCRDGTQKTVNSIGVRLETGELIATFEDVTKRMQAEKEIVDSRNFLQAVLTASPVGICSVRNRVIEWASESFCRMTGYSAEEMTENRSRFLYESDEEYENVGRVLYEQGWCETRMVRKNSSVMDCRMVCYAMDRATYVVSIEDITERKHLESQLLQAQKMEAIGTLAGGVAHDFNNILSVVTGYAGLMNIKMEEDNPLKIYVEHILSSVDKAVYLTQSLLAFSRKQVIDLKPININETIEKIEKILSRLIGEDIDLKTILIDDRLTVLADCGQLDQIFMNLAANARDAMPNGGSLLVETSVTEIGEEFVTSQGFGRPGRYARISVSDTGCGMDKKIQGRIFEPFFTTKEVGKGTGLGLSMVYGIVKQHNGFIQVQSTVDRGTMFVVYLPLIDADLEEEKDTEEVIVGGTETILVAEDERDLRVLMTTILANAGYTVVEAVDGEDAVRRFEEQGDMVDLVVLDVVMPRMNGKEAYDRIKSLRPKTPVLFASGYTDDIIHQKGVVDQGFDFIAKPLVPAELLKRIRDILDTWGG
ncbi:MAG: Blue-light-activated protein [Syntrophorhabdus sp. PtaB.Bin006]|nr:MAG: Blue-light-activated protein [Syntrophorhabdus sp. PtaB.Bin006]